MQTIEFRDFIQNFIQKWDIKEAPFTSYSLNWLDLEDVENTPCKDLDKINQLWINYSNGKFGFSIQKQIWIELGGKLGIHNVAIADMFIKEVGWGEKYKRYKNITYKISAPYGHLPFRVTSHVWNFGPPYIGKKLEKCNI